MMGKVSKKAAYVVRKGRKPGIFYTWPECDAQVTGFSGQDYEGFVTVEAAEAAWEQHLQNVSAVEAATPKFREYNPQDDLRSLKRPRADTLDEESMAQSISVERPTVERVVPEGIERFDEGPMKKKRFMMHQLEEDIPNIETESVVLTPEQEAVLNLALDGNNMFLTGAGGSGKTATIKEILSRFTQRKTKFQVLAPTGIAALPLRGKTTFSYLGLRPDSLRIPVWKHKIKDYIWKRVKTVDVIVIDEISMVDSQFLERMDLILQRIKKCTKPFGGIQVIFVGDFHQLPPVKPFQFCLVCGQNMSKQEPFVCVPCNEKKRTRPFAEADKWAFRAPVWERLNLRYARLDQIHRQKDGRFQTILNKIRNGIRLDDDEWSVLEESKTFPQGVCAVRLMARRRDVDEINRAELAAIESPSQYWESLDFQQEHAIAEEHFKAHRFPEELVLKVGAKVVLLINLNPERGLVNGSQGEVVDFKNATKQRTIENVKRLEDIQVSKYQSTNDLEPVVRFSNGAVQTIHASASASLVASNTPGDNVPKLVCRTQVPLALAWALTIHKSQGMTLEYLEVSSRDIFELGQLYVALSRGTTLEGTTLTGFTREQLPVDPAVCEFYEQTKWENLASKNKRPDFNMPFEFTAELEKEFEVDLGCDD